VACFFFFLFFYELPFTFKINIFQL
jgi:hypothetical protein